MIEMKLAWRHPPTAAELTASLVSLEYLLAVNPLSRSYKQSPLPIPLSVFLPLSVTRKLNNLSALGRGEPETLPSLKVVRLESLPQTLWPIRSVHRARDVETAEDIWEPRIPASFRIAAPNLWVRPQIDAPLRGPSLQFSSSPAFDDSCAARAQVQLLGVASPAA